MVQRLRRLGTAHRLRTPFSGRKNAISAGPVCHSSPSGGTARAFILSLLLLSPVVIEVLRKYLIFNNALFLILHGFLLACAVASFFAFRHNYFHALIATASLLTVWCIFAFVIQPGPILQFIIGVNLYLIPVLAFAICNALLLGPYRAELYELTFRLVTALQIVCALMALLQMVLGGDHFLNYMPDNLDATVGYFAYHPETGEMFFRPASVFMHPGKYGQVIFVLFVFRIFFILRNHKDRLLYNFLLIDFPALLISGQRVAIVLAVGVVICILLSRINIAVNRPTRSPERQNAKRSATPVRPLILALALLGVAAGSASTFSSRFAEVLTVAWLRATTSVDDIGTRLESNLFEHFSHVIALYPIVGEGPGRYALGAAQLQADFDTHIFRITENGWLRLIAEIGLVGTVLFFAVLASLVIKARRTSGSWLNETSCFVISMALWANTHDVYNNLVGMWLGFTLLGAAPVLARIQSSHRAPVPSKHRALPLARLPQRLRAGS